MTELMSLDNQGNLVISGDTTVSKIINKTTTTNTAIEIDAQAGGITMKVADEKELTIGNSNSDAYLKIAPSATAGMKEPTKENQ